MLNREKVLHAFEHKLTQFQEYSSELRRQQEVVRERLALFARYDAQRILDFVEQTGIRWPGSLPTVEFDQATALRLPFSQAWRTHEDARAWARAVLHERPVAAVDGSQFTPSKDFNIPVGAVQIGWFINFHSPGGRYIKDVEFEVLGPAELNSGLSDEETDTPNHGDSSWQINQRRFVLECERLCAIMAEYGNQPDQPNQPDVIKPLCFFDGSLIVSFASQLRAERGAVHVRALMNLLECAEQVRVPLVAYVDQSHSRDFVTLVDLVTQATVPMTLSDAELLDETLPNWGDRTPFFSCYRADTLTREGRADYYPQVAFCYMRLTRDRPPARVEMPSWLVATGRAEEIIDLVRAECVVGAGYPYAVETADALAVISLADRERFYGLFEQFVQRAGLSLVQARKAASKVSRR